LKRARAALLVVLVVFACGACKVRTNIGIDVCNVTNSSTTLTYNNTYGATWLRPQTFMPARFVKLTGQLSF